MNKLKLVKFLLIAFLFTGSTSLAQTPDVRMNNFVKELMQKMTLEEKIGQLNLPSSGDIVTGQASSSDIAEKIKQGKVGGLFNIKGNDKIKDVQKIAVEQSRLKIPLLFGMDVIHGYKTTFPIPLALSCSWDMDLIKQTARIAAVEASSDGISWTFSPMVDIAKDARWGRIAEGSGEDAYLGSLIAKAMVHGYQGNDLSKNNTIMSCVKHFALYGAAEGGRDYNTTDMSRVRMFNEYMEPYKAAVEAGVGSVMASFNEVDGIPATGNRWLMTDVLQRQWGFRGFTVSDYTGINEMIDHGMGNLKEVSALALQAGIHMDMVGEGFLTTLQKSLEDGSVTIEQIDNACRLILEAKYKLGLFLDPYKYNDETRAKNEIYTPEHIQLARKAASKSFVLLKNDKNILPLNKKQSIALIGPLADAQNNMSGTWAVATDNENNVTVIQGLKNALGKNVKINYAKGSNLFYDEALEANATQFGKVFNRDKRTNEVLLAEALKAAQASDIIVAALGESAEMSGESSSRTNLQIPDAQKDLLKALVATGKPVVLVLFTGRPLAITWEQENVGAILNVWFGGSETGNAIADVLYGDVNPSGKLTTTFPQNVGQVPIYYAHKNTGRPAQDDKWFQKFRSNYLDVSNAPLYPFGYGLSYTQFNYSNLKLSSDSMNKAGNITATVTLKNTGKKDGEEVVQLYLRDLVGSITRPVKELKGFQKIFLKAGETKEISFTITNEDLKFYNSSLIFDSEPGAFTLFIGSNSRDVLEKEFRLL